MNHRQERSVKTIMDLMLSLPIHERSEVWSAVTYNEIFCVHCGIGQESEPNPNCQCTNDE